MKNPVPALYGSNKSRCRIGLLLAFAIPGPLPAGPTGLPAAPSDSGWVRIFNGEDLAGLYTFLTDQGYDKDPKGVFQVRDSMIHSLPAGRGHIGFVNARANYQARVSWKFGPAGGSHNAGMLYHVDENAPKRNAYHPRSIECQMAENGAGELWTISGTWARTTIDPRTGAADAKYLEPAKGGIPLLPGEPDRRIRSQARLETLVEWNTLEIIVLGDSAVHLVNGKVALRAGGMRSPSSAAPANYSQGVPFIAGNLVLQAEGQEVSYRNWEIRTLNADGTPAGTQPTGVGKITDPKNPKGWMEGSGLFPWTVFTQGTHGKVSVLGRRL